MEAIHTTDNETMVHIDMIGIVVKYYPLKKDQVHLDHYFGHYRISSEQENSVWILVTRLPVDIAL